VSNTGPEQFIPQLDNQFILVDEDGIEEMHPLGKPEPIVKK
jgi:hypothetical protein